MRTSGADTNYPEPEPKNVAGKLGMLSLTLSSYKVSYQESIIHRPEEQRHWGVSLTS